MVHIPYDVWLAIVHFLPEEVLQNLRGLNRAFFDTAMDRRYRLVKIGNAYQSRDKRTLLRLQDHFVARRVHALHLPVYVFLPEHSEVLRSGLASKIAGTAKKALNHVTRSPSTSDLQRTTAVSDVLARTFAGMSALTDLHLYYDLEVESSISVVSVTRHLFGSNLQYLSLTGSPRSIAGALQFPVVFERLQRIALHLGPPDLSLGHKKYEDPSRRVTSFINGHHATLQDLELTHKFDYYIASDMPSILAGLGHFDCLHTFHLQAMMNTDLGLSALRNFISMHQHQLATVIITHRLPATFWDGMMFPKLESLNLAMNARDPHMVDAIIVLLKNLEPSLVGFKLKADYQLSDQELYSILGIFTPQSKLRRLALPLDFLSTQVLEFVAKQLPQLQLKLVNSHVMVA